MMDRNVSAAQRLYDDQEAAAEGACRAAAALHGLTPEQADECDDFSCGCLSCPWRSKPTAEARQ